MQPQQWPCPKPSLSVLASAPLQTTMSQQRGYPLARMHIAEPLAQPEAPVLYVTCRELKQCTVYVVYLECVLLNVSQQTCGPGMFFSRPPRRCPLCKRCFNSSLPARTNIILLMMQELDSSDNGNIAYLYCTAHWCHRQSFPALSPYRIRHFTHNTTYVPMHPSRTSFSQKHQRWHL